MLTLRVCFACHGHQNREETNMEEAPAFKSSLKRTIMESPQTLNVRLACHVYHMNRLDDPQTQSVSGRALAHSNCAFGNLGRDRCYPLFRGESEKSRKM